MKEFLTKEKIEGVNKIIDEYQASIKKPEPEPVKEPTPPPTEETVVEVVEEVKEVKPLGPKEFQMSRHVNGTINFSITDKPKHKLEQNTINAKQRMKQKYADLKEQKE